MFVYFFIWFIYFGIFYRFILVVCCIDIMFMKCDVSVVLDNNSVNIFVNINWDF